MKIIVFQHEDVEHPGVFRDLWAEAGHDRRPVELDAGEAIPDLAPFDLMVVMGGPMDVWQSDLHPWLLPEIAAIRHWVRDLRRPYFGICLGHQLLAVALGGQVGPMARPEVGLCSVTLTGAGQVDTVLSPLGPRFEAFQWHHAAVTTPPEGAEVLAANAACPVQAMRWGTAYGVQYHPELTARTVPEWNAIAEYRDSLDATFGAGGAARVAAEVEARLPAFGAAARVLNEGILALAGAPRTGGS